jgi:hypothetical protein
MAFNKNCIFRTEFKSCHLLNSDTPGYPMAQFLIVEVLGILEVSVIRILNYIVAGASITLELHVWFTA